MSIAVKLFIIKEIQSAKRFYYPLLIRRSSISIISSLGFLQTIFGVFHPFDIEFLYVLWQIDKKCSDRKWISFL